MLGLRGLVLGALFIMVTTGLAQAANHLVTKQSSHPFEMTLDRLEESAKNSGLTVFGRIDHAAAAKAAGLEMPPATVLVVGSPQGGTPLFLQHPQLAIDLPLKMLVWQDQVGKVFVSYNDAAFMSALFARHGFDAKSDKLQAAAKGFEGKLAAATDATIK
jgi:uncharacterized protein (DUF302 family)